MKLGLAILILTLTTLGTTARATQQVIVADGAEQYRIQVLSDDPGRTVINYRINSFEMATVEIDGETWSLPELSGRASTGERGLPALPVLRESLLIPDRHAVELRILETTFVELTDMAVAPDLGTLHRQGDPQLLRHEFADLYARDTWYPRRQGKLELPYILRDRRGVVVEIAPFSYNPVRRILRVYTSLTVEVVERGPAEINPLTNPPTSRTAAFERRSRRHFLNYEAILDRSGGEQLPQEPGSMLVIAHDQFLSAVEPLVDWKNSKGIPTRAIPISSVGGTVSQLREFLREAWQAERFTYLLLVGDIAQIPSPSWRGGAADPELTLLAGDDFYPDAFVGRLSAESVAQVETQVARIIDYERDAVTTDQWLGRAVGVGSSQGNGYGDDGEADWVHLDRIRDDLLNFTYSSVDRLYPNTGATAAKLGDLIDQGRGLICYTGHGSTTSWTTTGFDNADIAALRNRGELPVIISVACYTGNFTSGTCFAEAWLRAQRDGDPTGAVGMYASTVNQKWAPPMSAQDEIVDLMRSGGRRSLGELCYGGATRMIDEYGVDGESEFRNWILFGDPSLQVRSRAPEKLAVDHPDRVEPVARNFTVSAPPGALVGLSQEGRYLGSALTGADGRARIGFAGSIPSRLFTVTVTAFNGLSHVAQVAMGDAVVPTESETPLLILGQNYPNPFNPSTMINFTLADPQLVQLGIYDPAGRLVRTLCDERRGAGNHGVTWDGRDSAGIKLPSGIYFYRIVIDAVSKSRKMIMVD